MSLSHKIIKSHYTISDNKRSTIETDIPQVPLFSKIKEEPNDDSSTLEKEKEKLQGELKRVNGKLSNEGFVSKAPEKIINEEKDKKQKYEEMMEKVVERIESTKNNM